MSTESRSIDGRMNEYLKKVKQLSLQDKVTVLASGLVDTARGAVLTSDAAIKGAEESLGKKKVMVIEKVMAEQEK